MVIKSHRITNRPNDPIDGYFWRPLVISNSISAYPTYWTYVPPMVVWLKKITDKANGNCASYYKSGWWFDACFAANLNGKYYHGSYDGQLIRDGIYWGKWSPLRDEVPKCKAFWIRLNIFFQKFNHMSFQYADMKIRPRDFLIMIDSGSQDSASQADDAKN